jgi:hypothetical protein
MEYVSQYYCNSMVENCNLLTITVAEYSTSRVINSSLTYVQFDHSKGVVDNCYFGSHYFADSGNSIFEIKNSFFEHITSEIEFHHCLVSLNNNTIFADATNLMTFYNSLAIIENNYITSTDDECYNDGISVGSFAIISRNIFRGKFRAVLRCDYLATLVAYNNTFLEGCGGFSTASNYNNRMCFYNNIFFMQSGWDINLDYNTFGQGQNITYVDSNLSFRGDPYLTYYINNPQDSSVVYGSSYPLVTDPNFLDTNSCYLQSNSPAIDKGLTKIYSFGTQFSVLDTTVIIPDSITITSYYGLRPDLGAREYDPTVLVENPPNDKTPVNYSLSQNFPNPFNSSTLIEYSVPHTSRVSIRIYNTLGELVKTIVDEIKTTGEYKIELNLTNVSTGIYFYRLNAGNFSQTMKMILLK